MLRVRSIAGSAAALLLATVLPLSTAYAQLGGTGKIQGTVTDPSGAIVPGAVVSATNAATGFQTTRETSAAGVYVLSALPPGQYILEVNAAGFQPVRQENIDVDAVSTIGLNFAMKVGAVNEAVTVSAAPPPLDTEDARLGQTMRNEMYTARNAFANPAAYTYGDTPPTMAYNLRNPHLFNQDFSLRREFPVTERWRFELQGDAFNESNDVRFGGINTNITSSVFGRVTSQANTPRMVQISARIRF